MAREKTYAETIAELRQQRSWREHNNALEDIRNEYQEVVAQRDEAARRGDMEDFEMLDTDCERLEQDWQYRKSVEGPPVDPRMVDFMRRNQGFLEKYGQRGAQAFDEAHRYATRPRNPNTSNPAANGMGLTPGTQQYFDAIKDLMELYGKDVGTPYDRNESALTPNQAVRASFGNNSKASTQTYNAAYAELKRQGRVR